MGDIKIKGKKKEKKEIIRRQWHGMAKPVMMYVCRVHTEYIHIQDPTARPVSQKPEGDRSGPVRARERLLLRPL